MCALSWLITKKKVRKGDRVEEVAYLELKSISYTSSQFVSSLVYSKF